ncbi:SIS domain-containing protein [uncultured Jatrophihabitans sp.]|uniref:SIS domain-containing protein n=1 Tax=uncultured Jatrophihabitans sp. TaxID=1610747 RepID=UPI0035CA1E8C
MSEPSPTATAPGADATTREIRQQPELWREVIHDGASWQPQATAFLAPLLDASESRIVLTGAGTSAFVGDILAPALTRALGRRVDAVPTTDIVSNPRGVFAEDVPTVLVSFARSGDSPESVAATQLADRHLRSVRHVVITCSDEGRLYRERVDADDSLVLLMPPRANDEGFAMTSSFTSMVLAGWLALTGQVLDDIAVDKLVAAGSHAVDDGFRTATELAARGYDRVIYLGSGTLTGLAHESALKLLELTAGRTVTYFDSALGFRHGPKAVLDDRTLAVVYLSNDPYTRLYDEDIAAELGQAMGPDHVLVIGTGERVVGRRGLVGGLEDVDDVLLTLPFVVYAQTVGLQFSLAVGATPDNPFPGGLVNRVVQGVTIHPESS